MRREMTLCLRCSGLFKDAFKVTEASRSSERVACDHCGKKTFCSHYIIENERKESTK